MEIKKVVITDLNKEIKAGAEILNAAVSTTLGPGGRNVLIETKKRKPIITKDGVTVAKSINLEDSVQNLGVQIVKEAAMQTAEIAGDGTTTATVLATEIIVSGLKVVENGANPIAIKRGIDMAVKDVIEKIGIFKKNVETDDDVFNIANISANSDKEIGRLISEAIKESGRDGIIHIEEGKTAETKIDVVDGIQFDRGFLSPYFITNQMKMQVEMENPLILLYEDSIAKVATIVPLMEQCIQAQRPLLIIADNIDGEALATMVVNKSRGTIQLAAVRAPEFGDRRIEYLNDLAILTNTTVFSTKKGHDLRTVKLDQLGNARNVIVTNKKTTIIDPAGDNDKIQERVSEIQAQIETADSTYSKDKLNERLSNLTGCVVIMTIGAESEIELKEKRYRIDDALSAARSAIKSGFAPGGGCTLAYIKYMLSSNTKKYNSMLDDEQLGYNILIKALDAPFRAIMDNAFGKGKSEFIWSQISEANRMHKYLNKNFTGYDAREGKLVDMFEAGIIDPVLVIETAIRKSASVSGIFLTTGAAVMLASNKEKVEDIYDQMYGEEEY